MKLNIQQNLQPWKDAFDELIVKANESLSHVSQAVQDFYAPGYYDDADASMAAKRLIHEDGSAAYFCALAYQLDESSNRVQYADKAVELLNSWAAINETTSGTDGNEYMVTGGMGLIQAADLVWNYSGWDTTDRDNFSAWVTNVFQNSANAHKDRMPNLGSWGIWGSISAACLVENQSIIDADINLMKDKIDNIIASDGHMLYDTQYEGKGIWYTYYGLAPLTAAFQVVQNATGIDLFHYSAPSGRNIKMAMDNFFYYSQHPDEWPYYSGEVTNIPTTDSWPGNLFMAMAGIYDESEYSDWVTSGGSVSDSTWWDQLHIAWYFPVLMQPLAIPDNTPPVVFDIQPSGALPYGTTQTTITLTTDEPATCKYSTVAGTSYDSMTNTFSTTGGTSHSTVVNGLNNGVTYTYYIKCADALGNKNTDDFVVSFNIISVPPSVQNQTQIDNLYVYSTIENIAVIASFVGDVNQNNSAQLEYRESGGTWKSAIEWLPGETMWCDRRDMVEANRIGGATYRYPDRWGPPKPNPYFPETEDGVGGVNKAVIFFLNPDTEYQIRVIYNDPDGVIGENPQYSTISTKDDNPPSNGPNYYVSPTGDNDNSGLSPSAPWATIQHAADSVGPGAIINLMPGTHDVSASAYGVELYNGGGTEDNYITFQSYDPNNRAVIDGGDVARSIFKIRAPYFRFSNLILQNAGTGTGTIFWLDGTAPGAIPDWTIIEDCDIIDWGSEWPASGIFIEGAEGTLIQRNNIIRNREVFGGNSQGIMLLDQGDRQVFADQCHNTVIKENILIGNFADAVGGPSMGVNGHIYNNYGEMGDDDMWSADLWQICTSVWGNESNCTPNPNRGDSTINMQVSAASVGVGPLYVFRNYGYGHSSCSVKMGASSRGRGYFYNNTFSSDQGGGPGNHGDDNLVTNLVFVNNILDTERSFELGANAEDPFYETFEFIIDYNCHGGTNIKWPDTSGGMPQGLDYPDTWITTVVMFYNLAQFQNYTGLGMHGVWADPMLTDPGNLNFNLEPGSPCIDAATIVPGLNDANSPWPYSGSGPDIGAFEYDSGPAIDSTSPFTIGHNPAKGVSGVPRDTNIVVQVRDNGAGVDQGSIVMTVEGVTVTPTITGTPANYTVTYNPPSDFDYDQVVNVTINARDLASPSNIMPQDTYSFTIASEYSDNSPPYTTGHSPVKDAIDVACDTNIVVHVRDNGDGVDQSSIVMTVEGATVTPTITGSPADYTLTYNPTSDFDYDQVVNITIDAQDLSSTPHVMTQDGYSFTITSGYVDNAPPYVVGRNPANNAVGIECDTNIIAHIKDDGAGVDQSSIVMTVEGATVTPTITGTPADYTLTYNPPSDFDYDQVVNITIDAQDLSSTPHVMAQDAYSFTIVTEGSQVIYTPIRINCAGEEYTDTGSKIWLTDQAYNSGSWGYVGSSNSVDRGSIAIDGTDDDRIYQTERYALNGYQFDVGNGTYDIILHFAETYRNATGERVFDIYIEGQPKLINLDIYSEVGDDTALIKTFNNIAVTDNQLNIDFGFVTENPLINGIVITDSANNQPPVAANDSYSISVDTTLNIPSPGILSNDSDDDGNPLTAVLVGDVSHGNLTLNDNGSFIYTPDTGYTGTDSFTYNANDGQDDSNTATVSLNISGTNQAPILKTIGNKTVTEGQTLQFTISATDPDGDSMVYTATNLPSGAGFNQLTRVFIWTTDADDAGTYENVRFIVSDGSLSDYEDITITVEAASADTSPSGGGGGGGGGARGVTSITSIITPKGKTTSDINAMSSDLRVYLSIPVGTFCTTGEDAAIYWISIMNVEENSLMPPVPTGSNLIMPYYEIKPEGASFDPPIRIFFKYYESEIPEGADETDLVIMWWDPVNENWVPIATYVDTVNNIAWAVINHFSLYTLMINPKPASFEISQFNIDNPVTLTGETVTFSAVVTNTGALSGSYEAVLLVGEEIVGTQAVTLDGGCTETLSFTITPDTAGIYEACIGDCAMTFTVEEPAAPAAFVTTSLEATSATIELGETIGIDVLVTNTGDVPGSYNTVLLLDNIESQIREITVEGGQVVTVNFEITPENCGEHTVCVDDIQLTFEVIPVIDYTGDSVRTQPEVRNLGITPVCDVDTGKLISARINYQIVDCEELSPEAKLELHVYHDSEFLEKIPSLSLGHLQSNVYTSSLTYIPALGWEVGIYSIEAELINGDNPVQTTEPTQLTVTHDLITSAVSWKTLGVIIGSMLAVVSLTVVLILYRKRQMLRDYF